MPINSAAAGGHVNHGIEDINSEIEPQ